MQSLSKEVIEKIRQEVGDGKAKLQVARELGISRTTVEKYTRDMPRRKNYSPEEKEEIRELVKAVGVKILVSREFDIPEGTVRRITKDVKFKPGNSTIGGKPLQLLKELMEKGYVLLENNLTYHYRILKRHFPMIQKVNAKGKSIAFLHDKKEEALRFFLQNMRYRVMSYHELKPITRLFGVNLSTGEKQKFLGRSEQPKTPETQRTLDSYL